MAVDMYLLLALFTLSVYMATGMRQLYQTVINLSY